VRNTSYSFLNKNFPAKLGEELDKKIETTEPTAPDAETKQVRRAESRMLRDALNALPVSFRELLILRELTDSGSASAEDSHSDPAARSFKMGRRRCGYPIRVRSHLANIAENQGSFAG
jgi:hypothetical protein